ncbi:MAG TPA: RNase adapter RapZ [Clostridiales bacterium]|nr:RNase adapter RapZ [Clostridiales bacterium]
MRFVIITGMSGAGKSLAIKHMEDLGFFCVDNLPPTLLLKFAEICSQSWEKLEKVAAVVDMRGGEMFNELIPNLNELRKAGYPYEILFLDASDETLVKRYKESRRLHPLSRKGRISEGIASEREALEEVRKIANHILDTSNLSSHQFKDEISNIFEADTGFKGIIISIMSFGFKYGMPMDCDIVQDVRFIPNPFYMESLRRLTGRNEKVRQYVLTNSVTVEFLERMDGLLDFLLPNYVKEGKSQLVIGIGCTGGRHRSVAIADEIGSRLQKKGHSVVIEHRDIDKDPKHK